MEKIKLFSITHKYFNFKPKDRFFLGVGNNKQISNVDFYDNTGENISNKNANYCELTALYWIWKNCDYDIIGLEHYRRYLCTKACMFKQKPIKINKVNQLMKKYDIILPKKESIRPNIYEHYKKEHYASDLDVCRDIIEERYPEYISSFDKIMKSNKCSMFNIFVMKKEFLDEYCSWLFTILFECEKRIKIDDRDDYQKRVFGFLSERLFNVWLEKNKLKAIYMPVYLDGEKPFIIKFKRLVKFIIRL